MSSGAEDARVRSTLGHYRLHGEVGRDPLGVLHLACPAGARAFPKWAVVRQVHAGVARDPIMVHAFVTATQAAVRMVHRNVASTFDFGGRMALPWAAREHLFGASLLDVIVHLTGRGLQLPWPLACYLVAEAADGASAVRARLPRHGPPLGFLTGALVPYVFVTQSGEVKVVDGCVPLLDGSPLIDSRALPYRTGVPVEDFADGVGDGTFGLGAALWELVAGRRLFVGQSDDETQRLLDARVVPLLRNVVEGPPMLDAVVQRATGAGRNRKAAFSNAAELAVTLRAGMAAEGRRAGAEDVARMMTETFSALLSAQRAHVLDAWSREQALQAMGEDPADLLSESDETQPGDETQLDSTALTMLAHRPSSRPGDSLDDVPTVPRDLMGTSSSWRAVTPSVTPSFSPSAPSSATPLRITVPSIRYLPDTPSPVPLPVAPPELPPSAPVFSAAESFPEPARETSVETRAPLHAPSQGAAILVSLAVSPSKGSERRPRIVGLVLPPVERPPVPRDPVGVSTPPPEAPEAPRPSRESAAPPSRVLLTTAYVLGLAFLAIVAFGTYRRVTDYPDVVTATALSPPVGASGASSAPRVTGAPTGGRPVARATRASTSPWTPLLSGPVPVTAPDDLPHVGRVAPPSAPPPQAPSVAPASPPSHTGLLTVVCTPACDQVMDGARPLGPSPVFKVPVAAGVHRLRLRVETLSAEKTVSVTIRENDATVVRENLDE